MADAPKYVKFADNIRKDYKKGPIKTTFLFVLAAAVLLVGGFVYHHYFVKPDPVTNHNPVNQNGDKNQAAGVNNGQMNQTNK